MYRNLPILAAGAMLLAAVAGPTIASTFHFTVTADPRGNHDAFGSVLSAINTEVGGPGAFHVTVGDYDQTPAENRQKIDDNFGSSAVWYPVVGNHETDTEDTPSEMIWVRDEYNTGNGVRTPLKNSTLQNGPTGSVETTYSWNYGNAHFVSLNEYWNGGTAAGSDTATDGDVVSALYNWLAADLAANHGKAIFIFGHEPAFPANNHIGDSLDEHVTNRDNFWGLLESEKVRAYINGHTHVYSTHQGDKNGVGDVWQIDDGNAGNDTNGDGSTFLDVTVSDTLVTYDVWRDTGSGYGSAPAYSWTAPVPEPATMALLALGGAGLLRIRRSRVRR